MKRLLSIVAALMSASLLAACGGSGAGQAGASGTAAAAGSGATAAAPAGSAGSETAAAAGAKAGDAHMILRLANSHNEAHITSQACQKFADMVKDETVGRIEIQCFFAGQLGDERSTIEQCQFGGLDFTRVSSGASAEFAPLMNALQMPYEYRDVDHLFKVLDGEIGQSVFDTFKDNNLEGIVYLHPGSRCFFNAKKEIHTPADMAGLKIRVSENDLMLEMMRNLGAVGTPMPFTDTYSAIQTGVVDGAENNMTSYIEMSFYEVAPYWTYDNHNFMPDMILASAQTMAKLSPDDQKIIRDCAAAASKWHRDAWEASEEKNAKIAAEKGCTLTVLTPEEVEQFKAAVQPMYASFLNDEQKAIVEKVQAVQ